ncbi:hypothetical protein K469DRAFT_78207 [Zopfia rhizophila CBS 207.26]|uniref:Uncharacterized protein n=1 Tax=Zopfia rhizophila CBS 207.26 TaxID=1314779 RepID=A0A6A6D6V9_9PEZI|nr:hypothetical protein K469DRAFT_78207 [Zopfia rhizophila CBS 207.26]
MPALECHQKESLPTGMEDVISSKMVEGAGSQDDLPPCTSDEDEHRLREDDTGTRTNNQLEGWGTSALARRGRERLPISVEDAINSEMVEGEGTQAGGLSRRELTSTPPKFTIDDSPLLSSCDGKAKKTMRFADPLSMTNTRSSDTIEPNHIISEIDRDARSDRSIPKATTHQPQRPIEKKAKRQGDSPTLENASSSGGSDGDDDDDDDKRTMCGTLLTRKRKRSPPVNTISHKRCNRTSNTTSEQNPKHATHSTRRQKPSPLYSRPLSNRPSALKPASGAQYGGGDDSSDESSNESSEESVDRKPGSLAQAREQARSRQCSAFTIHYREYSLFLHPPSITCNRRNKVMAFCKRHIA